MKVYLNFYKYELKDVKTMSPIIKWQLDKPSDSLLQNIETDIVLKEEVSN